VITIRRGSGADNPASWRSGVFDGTGGERRLTMLTGHDSKMRARKWRRPSTAFRHELAPSLDGRVHALAKICKFIIYGSKTPLRQLRDCPRRNRA